MSAGQGWTVRPAKTFGGELTPPADKSVTHRAIMLASLAGGTSVIENYLPSEDCLRTLEAFRALGVRAERAGSSLRIEGAGPGGLKAPAGPLDAGNSGTTVRLLSGILAAQPFAAEIVGDESLSRRPMRRIIEPLELMGARIEASGDGRLPLRIRGAAPLKPLAYRSPVASAQVKSCILFAGLHADGETSVTEPARSRDHTERMLSAAGAGVSVDGLTVTVRGPARLRPLDLRVPGDISSAAFFIAAAAVIPGARLRVLRTGVNPTRDGIIEVLRAMGADIAVTGAGTVSGEPVADIEVKGSRLRGVSFGADIVPRLVDEIPAIAFAATQAEGVTIISGARELRVKESDRLKTVCGELSRLGARIRETDDGLVIEGPTPLAGAAAESHGDHRIAMMLAVAGLAARSGETRIADTACVDTSFPGFREELEKLVTR